MWWSHFEGQTFFKNRVMAWPRIHIAHCPSVPRWKTVVGAPRKEGTNNAICVWPVFLANHSSKLRSRSISDDCRFFPAIVFPRSYVCLHLDIGRVWLSRDSNQSSVNTIPRDWTHATSLAPMAVASWINLKNPERKKKKKKKKVKRSWTVAPESARCRQSLASDALRSCADWVQSY